jgi:prepilin-type N-terminal cleavage/methylation domain-containing protein
MQTSQRGLTLIELLVTIIILGFTMSLMSGAFNQIGQMLRISSEHSSGFLERWNRSRAVFDIISNMVIDPALERPFIGTPQELHLVTLASPLEQQGVARPIRISLKDAKESKNTEVWIAQDSKNAPPGLRQTELPGRIEFRFIDHQGNTHQQWPPAGVADARPMPSAIVLIDLDNNAKSYRLATYEGVLTPKNNAVAKLFGAGT